MYSVLMLFTIPFGGGIPAGVLLAREKGIAWPAMSGLYFISDLFLASVFEPLLLLMIAGGKKSPFLSRMAASYRAMIERVAATWGGPGSGPFALVMIAFGVDPMTGRTAAAAAGHGFISGWTLAIIGDMMYFGVIAAATLRLNAALGDPNRTMLVILLAMIFIPMVATRLRAWTLRRS